MQCLVLPMKIQHFLSIIIICTISYKPRALQNQGSGLLTGRLYIQIPGPPSYQCWAFEQSLYLFLLKEYCTLADLVLCPSSFQAWICKAKNFILLYTCIFIICIINGLSLSFFLFLSQVIYKVYKVVYGQCKGYGLSSKVRLVLPFSYSTRVEKQYTKK